MYRYTIPTITEAIVCGTETLRDRLYSCACGGVGTWEDPGSGAVPDVLQEVGDVCWVAHLDYCYYWMGVRDA